MAFATDCDARLHAPNSLGNAASSPVTRDRSDATILMPFGLVPFFCVCLLALGFNGVICWWKGSEAGLQFFTAYLLEWSLSMDNIFVFAIIFRYFEVPKLHQYRILYWGTLLAIVMRLALILAGTALVWRFQFLLPLFGLFLIFTGCQLARQSLQRIDPRRNLIVRMARRWLPLAAELGSAMEQQSPSAAVDYSGRFLVRQAGRLRIGPALLVLLVVESSDVLFALDSIPAIFGITRDPLIIFTSNIFAILGLRALYFLLAGAMDLFRYLHYGLAATLAFVGLKMVAEGWLPHKAGAELMPVWAAFAVIAALLGIAVGASMLAEKSEGKTHRGY